MSKTYDAIIIGGGHNGLTTAALLAKKGKKVLVVEKRNVLGGVAAGEEFYPGYLTTGLLHDTSGVRSAVIKELGLDNFGLKTSGARPTVSILSKDGKYLMLGGEVNAACAAIATYSQKDADAYREFRAFIDKISGFVNGLLNNLPPDLSNFGSQQIWSLAKQGLALKRLGKKTMMEFLKVAPMSVADFLNERFETPFIKAGLAAPAIYGAFTGPMGSYTTLNLLMWECAACEQIVGGPQALIAALEKAAKSNGVEIRTSSAVERIVLNKAGSVAGIQLVGGEEISTSLVAASCTPGITFHELLQPNQINYSLDHSIQHYRSRGTTAKVNLALNKSVDFNGVSAVEFARTGNSLLEVEKAFDAAKYRRFSEEPVLDIHVPTVTNKGLAPDGHAVISILVHVAPHRLDEGWTEQTKEKLLKQVLQTLGQYVPDLASAIVGSQILSPADFEECYSLTGGHIFHGEHAVDQMLTRPVPSCARYATPIAGLYLCGSGSHPGGGITCAPGYLAAKMILNSK